MFNNFNAQRKRSAKKLGNPRLLKIHFHTFRHWKATMEYHRTKDILYVMKLLGHKSIANTLIYTQLVEFEGDEYCSAAASNVEEQRNSLKLDLSTSATLEMLCSSEKGNSRCVISETSRFLGTLTSVLCFQLSAKSSI
jgi:hypothetical protein